MSKLREFVENWNKFLPDNQVSEEEFKNIQESSFRAYLILILGKLNVDTACFENMHLESGVRLRTSRLRLLSTVNHFLCIKNPMKLNYMNLVSPDFKTVTKSLMYLLNYVFFVNHFYKETISKCAQKVHDRDNLQTRKNQLRKNIETAKITEENNIKTLRDLDKTIPQQRSTIAALEEREKRLRAEVTRVEAEIEKSEVKCGENRAQIMSIRESIVSEEEAESILKSRQNLVEQLGEQEDIIAASRQKLKENSTAIEATCSLTTKMEAALAQLRIDTSDFKSMKDELESLTAVATTMNGNIARFGSEMESLTQRIQLKRENITKLRKQREELEMTIGSEDKANVQTLNQLTSELRDLCVQEDDLLEKRNKVKEEFNLLYTVASNLMKQLSENIYEE